MKKQRLARPEVTRFEDRNLLNSLGEFIGLSILGTPFLLMRDTSYATTAVTIEKEIAKRTELSQLATAPETPPALSQGN